MPLCTLDIPQRDLATAGGIAVAKMVCNETLDITLHGLSIPNPEDREIRIVTGNTPAKLSVEFTVGSHEYPGFTPAPEAFRPGHDLLYAVGETIHNQIKQDMLRIQKTEMRVWENTTFIPRSSESPFSNALLHSQPYDGSIYHPKLTLILAPQKLGIPSPLKEEMPLPELHPWQLAGEKMYALIAETLGISETTSDLSFKIPAYGDTDISVEFDCLTTGELPIADSLRQTAAEQVLSYLDGNYLTRSGSAEVWIRQGGATVFEFPPPHTPF